MEFTLKLLVKPLPAQLTMKNFANSMRLQVFLQLVRQFQSANRTQMRLQARMFLLEVHYKSSFMLEFYMANPTTIFYLLLLRDVFFVVFNLNIVSSQVFFDFLRRWRRWRRISFRRLTKRLLRDFLADPLMFLIPALSVENFLALAAVFRAWPRFGLVEAFFRVFGELLLGQEGFGAEAAVE